MDGDWWVSRDNKVPDWKDFSLCNMIVIKIQNQSIDGTFQLHPHLSVIISFPEILILIWVVHSTFHQFPSEWT